MNTPNKLTILRIILIPIFVVLYYINFDGWFYWSAAIFIIAAITDTIDGQLARRTGQVTDFGKFADPIADKLLVMSALLILMEWGKIPAWLSIILLGREFIISGFRLVAAGKGNVIAAGIAGKIKTVTQLVAISIMLLDDPIEKWTGIPVGLILLYISAALSIWSCAEYIIKNKDALSQMKYRRRTWTKKQHLILP